MGDIKGIITVALFLLVIITAQKLFSQHAPSDAPAKPRDRKGGWRIFIVIVVLIVIEGSSCRSRAPWESHNNCPTTKGMCGY